MKRLFIFLAVLFAAAVLAWLALPMHQRSDSGSGKSLHVVATFYPLAEFARQVGGARVDVRTLVPPGAEPHDYEPTPQDIVASSRSDVFLLNGNVDAWVERILPDLRRDGVRILRVADALPDVERDPHVWLDPVLAEKIVGLIRDSFKSADPAGSAEFDANAAAYLASLASLDAEYRSGLSQCATYQVVASHDALGYLAKEYSLDIVPIAGLSPDDEPSPARMADIAMLAKRAKAKYIFMEALVSPKLAETIADEVGAGTLVFNPAEGLTALELAARKDYLFIMRENLANLRLALSCK
jgi:zinc transport system substrate-binding protein